MLCEAVSRAHVRKLLLLTHAQRIFFIQTRRRVRDHIRVQRVSAQRRFHRLVVFRNGPSAILSIANRRPSPSGCMINGLVLPGAALLKSGISFPVHFAPFHWISIRFGSTVYPAGPPKRGYTIRDGLAATPTPNPVYCQALTGRRYHVWTSGCPAPSSYRYKSSRRRMSYRHRAVMQNCSTTGLSASSVPLAS